MKRRRLLVAAVASVAGCLGASSDSPSSTRTARTTSRLSRLRVGESATVDDAQVTLTDVGLQRFVRKDMKKDSPNTRVVADADRKYLTATFVEDGLGRPAVTADLRLDGDAIAPFERGLYDGYDVTPHEYRLYAPLALDVTADSGTVAFTSRGGDPVAVWTLPDDTLARLNDPPVFTVHGVSGPDYADTGDDVPVTIDLENTGGSDGTFIAHLGLSRASNLPVMGVDLTGGERQTVERRVSVYGGDEVTVVLDWGANRVTRTVKVSGGNESG